MNGILKKTLLRKYPQKSFYIVINLHSPISNVLLWGKGKICENSSPRLTTESKGCFSPF